MLDSVSLCHAMDTIKLSVVGVSVCVYNVVVEFYLMFNPLLILKLSYPFGFRASGFESVRGQGAHKPTHKIEPLRVPAQGRRIRIVIPLEVQARAGH